MSGLGSSNHFYLTLPSNSSFDFYGAQHPNNFKTKLEHTVSLDPEQWEVGLAEIVYPKSWNNVPRGVYTLVYPVTDDPVGPDDYPDTTSSIGEFGGTRYISSHHLVRDFHEGIKDALPERVKDRFRVRYDAISDRARIYLQHSCKIFMPIPLGTVLGLSSREAGKVRTPGGRRNYSVPTLGGDYLVDGGRASMTVCSYTVDVNRLLPTIFVYCDLVQQQFVGDSYVQLLRTLSVPEGSGETVSHKFTNIHYVNLQSGTFESIELKLTDSRGDPVGFKHGDVIAKLHFRRKQQ